MSLSPQRKQQLSQMLDELKARGAPASVADDAASQFVSKYGNEQPQSGGMLSDLKQGAEGLGTGLLTGVGKFIDDNRGLIGNLASLPVGGLVSGDTIGKLIPHMGDVTKEAGLQPGAASSIGSSIGRVAPYFIAPEAGIGEGASLLARMGSQAARGAVSSAQTDQGSPQDKLESAGTGAALAAGGEGLLSGLGSAAKPIGKYLSKNIYGPLMDKVEGSLKDVSQANLNAGAQSLKDIFDAKKSINNKAWDDATSQASSLDGVPFDNSDYLASLERQKQSLNDLVGNDSNLKAQYAGALNQLDVLKNEAPTSFRDAMRTRQGINAAKSNAIRTNGIPSDPAVNRVADGARKALLDQVNKNIDSTPEASSFGQSWANANKGFEDLQKYKQAPSAGTLKNSTRLSEAMNGTPEGKIFDAFMPTGKNDTGTAKFQHLANLLGDKEHANNLIKQAMFGKSLDSGFNPNAFITQYSKLSGAQKQYLFKPEENADLANAVRAKKIGDTQKSSGGIGSSIGRAIANHSLGTILGASAGHAVGHPIIGALIGAGLGRSLNSALAGSAAKIGMKNPQAALDMAENRKNLAALSPYLNTLTSAAANSIRGNNNG